MRLSLLGIGLAAAVLAPPALAFPSGPGTCVAEPMAVTGMFSRPRNDPGLGPYSLVLDVMATAYIPGGDHMITLISDDGSDFTGYLVYVETAMGTRVGTFDKTDPNVGSPVAACPDDPDATASHTLMGPLSETGMTIPWTAPATDLGPLFVRAIVLGGSRGNLASQAFFFPSALELSADTTFIFGDGFEE